MRLIKAAPLAPILRFLLFFAPFTISTSAMGAAIFYGPTGPYQEASDSPFDGLPFEYFHLEDFEDGSLDSPGLDLSADSILAPGPFTDSVDADDGIIDGDGTAGWSWEGDPSGLSVEVTLTITFDGATLGRLPTHAGFVFTNAILPLDITLEAFDGSGVSTGSLFVDDFDVAGGLTAATAQFFGAADPGGIGRLEFTYVGRGTTMEFDHFQYGAAPLIPIPPAAWLFGSALGLLGWIRRKSA